MPGMGTFRGYVILGPHAEWEQDKKKIPIALRLSTKTAQRKKVKKEKFDYVARGFDLMMEARQIPAQLEYSDKSTEAVVIKIETVH